MEGQADGRGFINNKEKDQMKLNTSSQVKQSSECAAKQMKSIWSSVKSGKTKNIQQIPLALLVRGEGLSIMAY